MARRQPTGGGDVLQMLDGAILCISAGHCRTPEIRYRDMLRTTPIVSGATSKRPI